MFYVIKVCKYFISLQFSRTLLAESFSFLSPNHRLQFPELIVHKRGSESAPFPNIVFENNLISFQTNKQTTQQTKNTSGFFYLAYFPREVFHFLPQISAITSKIPIKGQKLRLVITYYEIIPQCLQDNKTFVPITKK